MPERQRWPGQGWMVLRLSVPRRRRRRRHHLAAHRAEQVVAVEHVRTRGRYEISIVLAKNVQDRATNECNAAQTPQYGRYLASGV